MTRLRAFGRFWYEFVIGDDWVVAAGVVAVLGLVYGITKLATPAWWAAPLGVGLILPHSLRRAIRRR